MTVPTLVRLSLICAGYGGVAAHLPGTLRFVVNGVKSEWTNAKCPLPVRSAFVLARKRELEFLDARERPEKHVRHHQSEATSRHRT